MQKTVETLISATRLHGYRGKSNNHHNALLVRYNFNIELSRCFYAPLHLLEVTLRNTLASELENYLQDSEWLKNYKSHNIFQNREKIKLQEAIDELSKKKKPLESGRLIAELNLGFWINLYDRPYLEFQKQSIKRQFPNASNTQRNIFKIKDRLNDIRILRNRIFHYEPIWHWIDLDQRFEEIKELLYWMNSDTYLESIKKSEEEFMDIYKRQGIMLK